MTEYYSMAGKKWEPESTFQKLQTFPLELSKSLAERKHHKGIRPLRAMAEELPVSIAISQKVWEYKNMTSFFFYKNFDGYPKLLDLKQYLANIKHQQACNESKVQQGKSSIVSVLFHSNCYEKFHQRI